MIHGYPWYLLFYSPFLLFPSGCDQVTPPLSSPQALAESCMALALEELPHCDSINQHGDGLGCEKGGCVWGARQCLSSLGPRGSVRLPGCVQGVEAFVSAMTADFSQ